MRWTKCQMFEGKFAGMCGTSGFHVCCLFVHESNEKNKTNSDEYIVASTPIGEESDFTTDNPNNLNEEDATDDDLEIFKDTTTIASTSCKYMFVLLNSRIFKISYFCIVLE